VLWGGQLTIGRHSRKDRACLWATELLLDLPHNTYEQLDDGGVIIRKGSVRLRQGELSFCHPHVGRMLSW